MENNRIIRSLGITCLVGCISIALSDGVGILLRHNYNPLLKSVSDLALGPTGWVQDTGMYLGGIGIISCSFGLYLSISSKWEIRLGELFLLLTGIGIVFAAGFKLGTGDVHEISSIVAAISFLPVCFLISPAIRDHKGLFAYTIVAGIVALILEVGRARLPSEWMFFGLHERLIGANAVAWISTMAWTILIRHRNDMSVNS